MKISIALCTFNGEKFIREQLQSLFEQTVKADEIVVSDDGSKDKTLEIIFEFMNKNSIPIRILEHKETLGVFKNFEYCISQCSGDIIFTCDQDDYWMPNKLEKHMIEHTKYLDASLVYSNAEVVANTLDNIICPLWEPKQISDIKKGKSSYTSLVVKGQSIAGCCMSFRRDFFESILPIPDKIYHDDWIATSACLAGKIIGINECLIKYRQHSNNVVGIIRGSKLSFYKSLFTNVKFYTEADTYIYQRHLIMYSHMIKHDFLKTYIKNKGIENILELYNSRSNYLSKPFSQSLNNLSRSLFKGHYTLLNGVWTYLKDVYNLLFTKMLLKKRNLD